MVAQRRDGPRWLRELDDDDADDDDVVLKLVKIREFYEILKIYLKNR